MRKRDLDKASQLWKASLCASGRCWRAVGAQTSRVLFSLSELVMVQHYSERGAPNFENRLN